MHDSSTCPICHGLPVDDRMTDAEFFAFLSACRDELAYKQSAFQQRISGGGRWVYDLRDNSLTIGSERFPITAIGTYSVDYETWLWAWANPSIDADLKRDALRVLDYGRQHGVERLTTPKWPADETDGWRMAALANRLCSSNGAYRGPAGKTVVFMTFGEIKLEKRPVS